MKHSHRITVLLPICISCVVLMLLLNYLMPFTLFFKDFHSEDEMMKQAEAENEVRTNNARQHFTFMNANSSHKFYMDNLKAANIPLAIGIISVKRYKDSDSDKGLGYVLQSASLIDAAVKTDSYLNGAIAFICNVDLHPQAHLDATNLYPFMPYVERYGGNSLGLPDLKIPSQGQLFKDQLQHSSKYRKETLDYAFCLQAASKLNPRHILLLEEDTIPHPGFARVLDYFVNLHVDATGQTRSNYFTHLKLYYPLKWQGFGFTLTEILDLISVSCVGAFLFTATIHSFKVLFAHGLNINYSTLCISGFLLTMIFCYLLGRQNISEFRRISKYLYRLRSSDGCCTQAMLYPLHIVDSLSQFLVAAKSNTHTDLIIWDFLSNASLPAFQIEPNLFHHTGLFTSLEMPQKHPEEFLFHS